jgi:predicted metal-binding membrane protein
VLRLSQVLGAAARREVSRGRAAARDSELSFFVVSAMLFVASAAGTVAWCGSMPGMRGLPMPGGWATSMAWRSICGQRWSAAAPSFLGMWLLMMAAMMLPSLVPMLLRYREDVGERGERRLASLTLLVAAGYFFLWAAVGIAVFAAGAALGASVLALPPLGRAVPVASGMVVLGAGAVQFTRWKARHLAVCRAAPAPGRALAADAFTAWRHGLRLGVHCGCSSAGLTAVLLVAGVMDLRVMAVVTAAITLERLAPSGARVARGIGAVTVLAGLFLIARGAGFA